VADRTELEPPSYEVVSEGIGSSMPPAERLRLLCWHLDRYDRLRASTASRAGVVLGAGTLLAAANAVIIAEAVGAPTDVLPNPLLLICMVLALVSTSMVLLVVIQASSVLVTFRDSRSYLVGGQEPPIALIFNGADTVRRLNSYDSFNKAIATQGSAEAIQAAEAELWINIHQHRSRYVSLRRAVRIVPYASFALLLSLAAFITSMLLYRIT
jgi:hypothetical protein